MMANWDVHVKVFDAVDGDVFEAVSKAVSRYLNMVAYKATGGFEIDALSRTLYDAGSDSIPHPALQVFLSERFLDNASASVKGAPW